METAAPLVLGELLDASDSIQREAAWEELISRNTKLLLGVARSLRGDHDEIMERYSYILGKLREGNFHRLRTFDPEGGASFSTWLAVAARRLCLDYHRNVYGRQRATTATPRSVELRLARRSLADSIAAEIDTDYLPDAAAIGADVQAVLRERDSLLCAELSRLSPRERLILALRFQDGLSASRMARILSLPTPFHVYRQLNGILRGLRTALLARGLDGSDG
jgi:RNA polymerase sigma factor (sigma-70 family)